MPLLLEIPLQVVLVGSMNSGKSLLAKQLLQKDGLSKIFSKTLASEDEEPEDIIPSSVDLEHNAKATQYPPHTALPPFSSIGTTHHSEEFEVDVYEDGKVKIIFVLEIFEIGGANCCGKYMDKDLLRDNCANNADLIIGLYDLCDRSTLLSLMNDSLPIVCEASFQGVNEDDDKNGSNKNKNNNIYTAPIFITGTKIDSRKKLSAEERKNAVVGPDQKALDSKFVNLLTKSKCRSKIDGLILSSVSSTTGSGIMRLRREIFLELLRKKKPLLENLPLADRNTDLWSALTEQQVDVLQKNVGENLAKARGGFEQLYQELVDNYTTSSDKKNTDDEGATKHNEPTKKASKKDDDDEKREKLEPPVLDTKVKDNKKKGKNGGDEDEKEKGVKCGMCGCASQ